jgi:hypothetical protein
LSRRRLELKPSPALAAGIVALHAVAGLSVLLVVPAAAGGLLAAGLLALGIAAAWSRALLRARVSPRVLELGADEVILHLAGGASLPVEVAKRRYVAPFMVALPILRPMRRTILVTQDMLDRDSFRALRVWALWGKLPRQPVARKQLPS